MKLKIFDSINWQRYPETKDMVDVKISELELSQIGISLCFDMKNNFKVIPYVNKNKLIDEKINRLNELTKDFAQVQAGLIIDDIEERKSEFRTLLNEVRVLQGKEPRNAIDSE